MNQNRDELLDQLETACADEGFGIRATAVDEAPLHLEADFHTFGALALARSRTSPLEVTRSRREISKDPVEIFVLPLHRGGGYQLTQSGKENVLGTGTTRLIAGNEPFSLRQRSGGGINMIQSLAIPADILRNRVAGVDDVTSLALDENAPASAFLNDYLSLATRHAPADPGLSALIGSHAFDLLAVMLASPGRARKDACADAAEAVKAARSARLTSVMRLSATEPGLTLEIIAARMKMSRRSVQMLFAGMDTSFSAELTRLRVDHALNLLMSMDTASLSIAEVAFASGFSDLSTFNRSFRRATGLPPGAFRDRAAQQDVEAAGYCPATRS